MATINRFAEAYAQNSRLPEEMSPFTAPDYRDLLDRAKLLELVQKA